jgi:hypothetical protein
MKLRCFQCFGPFGLTRHHHHCHAFCSQKCVTATSSAALKEKSRPMNL